MDDFLVFEVFEIVWEIIGLRVFRIVFNNVIL